MTSQPLSVDVLETDTLAAFPTDVIVEESCRTALRLLPTLSQPVPERTLARHVAAVLHDETPDDVPESALDDLHLSLHHEFLPKLSGAGIVEHHGDAGTVTLTERIGPANDFLATLSSGIDDRTWAAFEVVRRDARRAHVLDVLAERDGGLSRMALATELADREPAAISPTDGNGPLAQRSAIEKIEVRLHHVDLPKLDAIDLVAYDCETGTVEIGDHSLFEQLTP